MRTISFHGAAPEYLTGIPMAGRLIVVEGTDGVGRSTHVVNLRQWLEVSGHAVVETGWTRSKLVGRTIDKAKSGHMLSPLTYTLLYACDFADRLEKEIIPALRAGYVVLADRYIYTALARCSVRGMETDWLARLFAFAPVPDLVLYLRLDAPALARRVLLSSGIDYWEAGKDMFPQMDIYDSFVAYQSRILEQFDAMCGERSFQTVDARKPIEQVQEELRSAVARLLCE
ncbi:MAG: thymidylate kinase [Phycisphaerales bacterium]|nr:thymidylate kinase [Phycisphaerales bacterium]